MASQMAALRTVAAAGRVQRRLAVLGLIACSLALLCPRPAFQAPCFASGAAGIWQSRSAGSSPQSQRQRIALHEEVGARSLDMDAKTSLLQALLRRQGAVEVEKPHLRKLVAQLERDHEAGGAAADSPREVLRGAWRSTGMGAPASRDLAATVSLFSGGQFAFEGSALHGGLFRGLLRGQGLDDAEVGPSRMSVQGEEMVVSATVRLAGGRQMSMSYSAQLEFQAFSRGSFMQSITSLDLPAPVGSRKPILEDFSRITVTYADDEMVILGDSFGNSEVFVRDSSGRGSAEALFSALP